MENSYGYKSHDGMINLIPSTIGNGWFHVRIIEPNALTEVYSKRPIALSRIKLIYSVSLDDLEMYKCEPKEHNYNERKSYSDNCEKTNLYFIEDEANGAIKIGVANCPETRMRQLQVGNPNKLFLLKVIDDINPIDELDIHEKYKNYRIRGEWFNSKIKELI